MNASKLAELIARGELSSEPLDQYADDGYRWRQVWDPDVCFVKVFDASLVDNNTRPAVCRASTMVPGEVPAILNALPDHPEGVLRIYIEDVQHAGDSWVDGKQRTCLEHLLGHNKAKLNTETGFLALKSQWGSGAPPMSYEMETYFYERRCARWESREGLRTGLVRMKMEVYMVDIEEKPSVFISLGPGRELFDLKHEKDVDPSRRRDHICEWNEAFCSETLKNFNALQTVVKTQTPQAKKQLFLLSIHFTVMELLSRLFGSANLGLSITLHPALFPRHMVDSNLTIDEYVVNSHILHEIDDGIQGMVESMHTLLDLLSISKDEASPGDVEWRSFVTETRHLCTDVQARLARLLGQIDNRVKVSEMVRGANEASRVRILSLLASIFLPLSASASILSMQTRFMALHELLYDFVGVVILLASFTFLVFYFLKVYLHLRDVLARDRLAFWGFPWRLGLVALKPFPLLLWPLSIASFLVGMIKDIGLGARILGFGAAAIAGMALCVILAVCCIPQRFGLHLELSERLGVV